MCFGSIRFSGWKKTFNLCYNCLSIYKNILDIFINVYCTFGKGKNVKLFYLIKSWLNLLQRKHCWFYKIRGLLFHKICTVSVFFLIEAYSSCAYLRWETIFCFVSHCYIWVGGISICVSVNNSVNVYKQNIYN